MPSTVRFPESVAEEDSDLAAALSASLRIFDDLELVDHSSHAPCQDPASVLQPTAGIPSLSTEALTLLPSAKASSPACRSTTKARAAAARASGGTRPTLRAPEPAETPAPAAALTTSPPSDLTQRGARPVRALLPQARWYTVTRAPTHLAEQLGIHHAAWSTVAQRLQLPPGGLRGTRCHAKGFDTEPEAAAYWEAEGWTLPAPLLQATHVS